MDRLLFNLAHLECREATWWVVAGDPIRALTNLRRAIRLLEDVRTCRRISPAGSPIFAGDDRRGRLRGGE
jgi:hypothetical protein